MSFNASSPLPGPAAADALSFASPVHKAAGRGDTRPPVTVVLCTYQGARHVGEQLDSIVAQRWPVQLLVVDDGSTDDTVDTVRARLREGTDVLLQYPDNVGYVRNFERAVAAAVASGARYLALSDQDDVWHPERIGQGMQALQQMEQASGQRKPCLVHSDLHLINEAGDAVHDSFLRFRRYRISSEQNLPVVLGENGVMGNTVLMNRALATLSLPFPEALHVHDYWLAVLAELFGQRQLLAEPYVNYRLHGHNASNTAASMQHGWQRLAARLQWRTLLACDFKLPFKEDARLPALQLLLADSERFPPLTSEQYRTLDAFVRYLCFQQPRWRSLHYLLSSGVARGGFAHRLRLCAATLLTRRYSRSSSQTA